MAPAFAIFPTVDCRKSVVWAVNWFCRCRQNCNDWPVSICRCHVPWDWQNLQILWRIMIRQMGPRQSMLVFRGILLKMTLAWWLFKRRKIHEWRFDIWEGPAKMLKAFHRDCDSIILCVNPAVWRTGHQFCHKIPFSFLADLWSVFSSSVDWSFVQNAWNGIRDF